MLALLDLPTEHFLRLKAPLPSALLAAAAVVVMHDEHAQQLYDRLTNVSTTSAHTMSPSSAMLGPPGEVSTVSIVGSAGMFSNRPDEQAQGQTLGGQTEGGACQGGLVPLSGTALSMGRAAILQGPREQLSMLRTVKSALEGKLNALGGVGPFLQ